LKQRSGKEAGDGVGYPFYDGLPPHQKPETSLEAAALILPSALSLRDKVYEYLQACGSRGATDREIEAALHMLGSTVRPRRRELEMAGRIELARGLKRLTPNGRWARVWRVKQEQLKLGEW